ncbi:MAG: DUF4382 domain-containing protein [Gemmatimonas sp.]|nr:DUF4382 domain-containing protein [Gemmatimonas sp.]
MFMKRLLKILPLVVAPLALVACDQSTGPRDGHARLSILLTDAPGDFETAVVTITDIYLQGEGEDGGRTFLRQDDPITTDLLTLANDVVEVVDDYEIPEGVYGQLRFVISGAYIEVEAEDGGTVLYATSPDYEGLPAGVEADGELVCPSCSETGFKVLLGPVSGGDDDDEGELVVEGDETILVDFNVSETFGHQAGKSGKWVMHPTLKATRLVSAATVHVALAADSTVEFPLIEDDTVRLDSFEITLAPTTGGDPTTVSPTDSDDDGVFEATFAPLLPGDYQVRIDAGVDDLTFETDSDLPVNLMVTEGSETTVDILVTELSLEEPADDDS